MAAAIASPVFLDAAAVRSLLPPPALFTHLRSFLPAAAASVQAPARQHYPVDSASSSSLLLMPSWSSSTSLAYLGVKIVTSFPNNSSLHGLPGVNAAYVLFSSATGAPLASLDGTQVTLLRTAAVSALAASFLARDDAEVLVVAGAGNLASYLVRAHLLARPSLRRVIPWNRTAEKARDLAGKLAAEEELSSKGVTFEHAENLDDVLGEADVVSCSTSSVEPFVKGALLKAGAHLDLVGSFTPSMMECDDTAIAQARVFVDCEAAMEEAGELVGAFERGVVTPSDIEGTLVQLLTAEKEGRRSPQELTVFKSVGTAMVDLLAAQLAYENFLKGVTPEGSINGSHQLALPPPQQSPAYKTANDSREDKVKWTEKTFGIFRKLCIEQVKLGNRSGLTLSSKAWEDIGKSFHQQTGQLFTRDKFKNKWDVMRKEYKEWIAVKNYCSEHGWDPLTNTIKASDDWWNNYLKVHPYASRFRKQGLEHENDYRILFSVSVGIGKSVFSPTSDPTSRPVAPIEDQDANPDGHTTWSSLLHGARDDATKQSIIKVTNVKEDNNSLIEKVNQQTKFKKGKRKRNLGISQLAEKIGQVVHEYRENRRARLETKQSTSTESDMLEAQKIIEETLPPEIDDDFRFWAISCMTDQMKRALLKTIKMERRLGWLQFEYNQWRAGKKL